MFSPAVSSASASAAKPPTARRYAACSIRPLPAMRRQFGSVRLTILCSAFIDGTRTCGFSTSGRSGRCRTLRCRTRLSNDESGRSGANIWITRFSGIRSICTERSTHSEPFTTALAFIVRSTAQCLQGVPAGRRQREPTSPNITGHGTVEICSRRRSPLDLEFAPHNLGE